MNRDQTFVKMAVSAWETHISRASELVQSLSDEQLLNQIAPNKNSVHSRARLNQTRAYSVTR